MHAAGSTHCKQRTNRSQDFLRRKNNNQLHKVVVRFVRRRLGHTAARHSQGVGKSSFFCIEATPCKTSHKVLEYGRVPPKATPSTFAGQKEASLGNYRERCNCKQSAVIVPQRVWVVFGKKPAGCTPGCIKHRPYYEVSLFISVPSIL